MPFVKTFAIVSVIALLGAGCASSASPDGLVKIKTPSGDTIKVATAITLDQQAQGLSGSENIGDGMIFCFPEHKVKNFWMLDMHVPIDMIWIENEKVRGVADNVPIETDNDWTRRSSEDAVNIVLEVPAGRAAELGIVPGSELPDANEICS
ncbi:DUF192 domain-containing protein [Candidatus Uhrbacteria bacterium]|nr:DUF192 domain-containing protein [Candidatus Uhrbacteria bacterium]